MNTNINIHDGKVLYDEIKHFEANVDSPAFTVRQITIVDGKGNETSIQIFDYKKE